MLNSALDSWRNLWPWFSEEKKWVPIEIVHCPSSFQALQSGERVYRGAVLPQRLWTSLLGCCVTDALFGKASSASVRAGETIVEVEGLTESSEESSSALNSNCNQIWQVYSIVPIPSLKLEILPPCHVLGDHTDWSLWFWYLLADERLVASME